MSTPFWLDGVKPLGEKLAGDIACDVVVVGAGLCGVSAAKNLCKEGVDTVLIDARGVSFGATGRNAGFILQGTAERYNRAIEMMGREKARQVHRWSLINHDLIAQTIREDGISCDYRRAGSLQLAGSPEEEHELLASAKLLQEDGFTAELWQEDRLSDHYRAGHFRMGVYLPQDGELQPAQFVRQAVQQAQKDGLRLYEWTPALSLEDSADEVLVETPSGTIRASIAIVCLNAYTPQLLPSLKGLIDPVRGQMLATKPAPRLFDFPIYADHGYDYWRQDSKGRIVLGGWRNLDPDAEVGFDESLHPEIQQKMIQFLRSFPGLTSLEVSHRWSGIMGFSRDGLPLIGTAPGYQNTLIGAGFTGHGFGFAWLAGHALAQVATEGQHSFADLMSSRRFL